MELLKTPIFGICFSLILYTIGQHLFKKSKGFFLLQPLFFAMVSGIVILWLMSKGLGTDVKTFYTQAYKPGGDLIFWFLNPATIAFAVPLYKKNDVVKKYWVEILSSLVIGMIVSLMLIVAISKMVGLSQVGIAVVATSSNNSNCSSNNSSNWREHSCDSNGVYLKCSYYLCIR